MLNDSKIKKNIIDQLKLNTQINIEDIEVIVEKGVVTLLGTVPSYNARQSVERDVWIVKGVNSIISDINILLPINLNVPSDSDIQVNCNSILEWSTFVNSNNIDIYVEQGIVTLEGFVDSYWKKFKAEELLNDVIGVIEIINNIIVVPANLATDQDIIDNMIANINRSVLKNSADVDIAVKNGVATISGKVYDYTSWESVFNSAVNTPGVKEVLDNLKIITI